MGRGMSGAAPAPTCDGAGSPADTDQRLVARVRRGDDRAFELLYQRYQRRIHAYVLGMVKDHGRAEDVDAGGLRLRAAAHARDRAAAGVQAVALPDRQEQLHRRVPPLQAHRGGLLRRRRRAGARGSLQLVGSGPSPTPRSPPSRTSTTSAARSAGFSETHHEILVLRELEGLPTSRSASRMGMSRPAVESTLFRARRRLTEEYDDIVSGARCERIQGIIVAATQSVLGTRDTRRLARHLSHCQRAAARRWPPGWTASCSRARPCASGSPRTSPGCCRSRRC